MNEKSRSFVKFTSSFLPKEEMLEVNKKKGNLFIGIPKETSLQENRVPLIPDAVALLVNNGHKVVIESGAGKGAHFEDKDFSEQGAKIAYSAEEVYNADLIVKVEPPSLEEIKMLKAKQKILSVLQLAVQVEDYIRKLAEKKVTAIAYNYILDEAGIYPVVRSMSEIAGITSILIAAEYLSNVNDGLGIMLGGIAGVPPTEVVILGAGTVGEFAARTAIGLGATVKVFDSSIFKLRRLQNIIGERIFTSTIQPKILKEALMTTDVLIGAIRPKKGTTPCIVTENMVKEMKYGAVIIDISIDQGGCIETSAVTSHKNPVFKKYGVIHYGVPNVASRVARTASTALSNILAPLLLSIGEEGGFEAKLRKDKGLRNGVYLYNGILTNEDIAKRYNMDYKDLDLLMAAM